MPPAVIAGIVVVSALASTAVAATAAVEQGQQAKKSADYQSKELNQQALEARQQGALQVAAQDQRAAQILSSIRSSAAASGVEISSGSPLEVYNTSSEQAQINDMYTRYSTNLQASGIQAQSELTSWGGKNAATAGYLTAGGETIQGLGNLAQMGLTPKAQGGLGWVN